MRRSPIRRKPRTDAVPPEVAAFVFARDGYQCVAPRLGGTVMDCFGKRGLEHVKKEPRMGIRAEPLASRLVVLCDGHREPGMRGGFIWCTDKRNREACREYLRTVELPDHAHVELVHGCPDCDLIRAVAV